MDAHQIRIEDTSPDFALSRANDQLLIPLFHEQGIRDDQLQRLNRCRLFLQVLTISDITTGCGTKITKAAWNGVRDTTRTSSYQWPSQGIPSALDWVLWRQSLTTVLRLQSGTQLIRPLGHWFPTVEQCRWFFDPSTERLYEKAGSVITYYPRAPGRPSRNALMKFNRYLGSPTPGIPASAERATVEYTTYLVWLTGNSPSSVLPSYLGKWADFPGSPLSLGPSYQLGSYTCDHYGRRLRDCQSYSRRAMCFRERRFL
jgi:hypothetical protein